MELHPSLVKHSFVCIGDTIVTRPQLQSIEPTEEDELKGRCGLKFCVHKNDLFVYGIVLTQRHWTEGIEFFE